MGAEEFGGAVGCGGGGGEVLPEFDAFSGVVTGAGHVEGAEFVGFEFLAAGEAEHAEAGDGTGSGGGGDTGDVVIAEEEADASDDGGGDHADAHFLAAVTGDDVGEFVADDGCELGVGAGDLEDAGVDADFAAGEGEGVGGFVFEEDELPVGVLDGDVAFEALGDAVEGGGLGGVMGDAFAGLHALELGEAHFIEFGVGDEVEGAAAGVGDGGAGVEGEGGGEAQGQVEAQVGAWHGERALCDTMVPDLARSSTVCTWRTGPARREDLAVSGGCFLQALGDLDGVEGGAFEELVADDPEGEAIVEGAIHAEAADGAVVLACDVEGQGILFGGGVVDDVETGGFGEDFAGGGDGDGLVEFGADGDAVGAEDGDADAGDAGAEVRVVHDFAAFVFELHFLFGVTGVEEGVDVGEDVEGDLVRVDLDFGGGEFGVVPSGAAAGGPGVGLAGEFFDGLGASAGDGLVARGPDALDAEGLVQGVEGHQGDGGGAVGVGDDALVGFDIGGVHLGDDEGDGGVHAEGGGVVDDDGSGFDGVGGEFFGDATAGAEEGDVDAFEGVRGQFFDGQLLAFERHFLAGAAGGGEEGELADGEVAFLEAAQHFDAHRSGGADDGDVLELTHG